MPTPPLAFLRAHKAEARHALRVMAATAADYALYVGFDLPQGYWAVFTTLIVMQASIGGTVGASVDRMYGTLLGAALGGGAAALLPFAQPEFELPAKGAAVMITGGIGAYVAMLRPSMKVAPVTAAIMILSSAGTAGPLHAAAYRVVEIAVGSAIGVAATLLIFPARSRTAVADRTGAVLDLLSGLLLRYAGWLEQREAEPAEALFALHARIRSTIGGVEQAVDDAERERTARLGDHHLSPATPRTLWRIRNEAATMGGALRIPWPEALRARLSEPGARMLHADAAFLEACHAALAGGRAVERGDLLERHEALGAAVDALRRERITEDLTLEEVGAAFSFVFALESLYGHLCDLADRVDEAALGRPARPPGSHGGEKARS